MGLADIVRSGVATANKVTGGAGGLQDTVTFYQWTGSDDFGAATYSAAITLNAIVDMRQGRRRLSTGEDVIQQASLTILQPVAANGATGRREPVDPRDKFVLPNGYTGPILGVSGPMDPATNAPFMVEVVLG